MLGGNATYHVQVMLWGIWMFVCHMFHTSYKGSLLIQTDVLVACAHVQYININAVDSTLQTRDSSARNQGVVPWFQRCALFTTLAVCGVCQSIVLLKGPFVGLAKAGYMRLLSHYKQLEYVTDALSPLSLTFWRVKNNTFCLQGAVCFSRRTSYKISSQKINKSDTGTTH